VTNDLSQLHRFIADRFDLEELRTLCFDLGVNYDELGGEGLSAKARELLAYLDRRDRIPDLTAASKRLRPDISWPELHESPKETPSQQKLLHNIPPRSTFIGRETEKALVHKALHSPPNLVSIDGIGGIGKTALALEVAHDCLHASQGEGPADEIATFDGFIWTTAKDRDLNLDNLLDAIARTLDYPGIAEKPAEEKQSAVRKLLRARPCLLIVDNFETITDESVRSFLLQLPEPSRALITTREQQLPEAWTVSLSRLTQPEGLDLIRSEGGRLGLVAVRQARDQVLLSLYQATGGVPLAIKWAVGQIKQRGQSLDTVLEAIRSAEAPIFDSIFARSWELLSVAAQRVIAVMPLFATSALWESIRVVSDVQGADFEEALGQLVEMSLMDATGGLEQSERRYSIHPLTRAFVTKMHKSEQAPQFAPGAFERMLTYYKQLVAPSEAMQIGVPYWDGLANFAQAESLRWEWDNLANVIRMALDEDRDAIALDLFLPLVHFLHIWGLWDERLQLSREMCRVARRRNDSAEVWLRIDAMGYILRQRQHLSECIKVLGEGRSLAHQFDLDDALILADVHEAGLYAEIGDADSSKKKIEQALKCIDLDAVKEHGTPVRRIVTRRAVGTAAFLSRLQQDTVREKEWYEYELELRYLVRENPAPTMSSLAYISLKLDDLAAAAEYLKKASVTASRKDKAWIDYEWAVLAGKRGKWQEARDLCTLALEQFTRLRQERGVAECRKFLSSLPKPTDHNSRNKAENRPI
jgi:tetratricopeptide (TPR) repeat protein